MAYVYQDFSKKDKKLLQSLEEVGVKREIAKFLKETFLSYQTIMETEYEDIRKPYWKLSDKFRHFSKELIKRYDGNSHTDLPTRDCFFIDRRTSNGSRHQQFFGGWKEKIDRYDSEMAANDGRITIYLIVNQSPINQSLFQSISRFRYPMPDTAASFIIKRSRCFIGLHIILPIFCLFSIIFSNHCNAVFHRADKRTQIYNPHNFFQ